jgi:predicted XRE-type DNA-binding protein
MAKPRKTRKTARPRVPDEEIEIKVQLADAFRRTLKERGLTQLGASEELGITQPNIWEVLHGRLRGYSVARLMRFLIALGYDIDIHIKEKPRSRPARIAVREK